MHIFRLVLSGLMLVACGGSPDSQKDTPTEQPLASGDPAYPDYTQWEPVRSVRDPEQGETRTLWHDPEGQRWAKVHHPLDDTAVITQIDVHRETADDQAWQSWDPARRVPVETDEETCVLCHSMAPKNHTWIQ